MRFAVDPVQAHIVHVEAEPVAGTMHIELLVSS